MDGRLRATGDARRSEMEQLRRTPALHSDRRDEDVACAYLTSLRRLTQAYQRRRATFQKREDEEPTDRMFILSDDRPWTTFSRETRMQRKRWVFETCGVLQWTAAHDASRTGDLDAVKKALSTRHKHALVSQTLPLRNVSTHIDHRCALRRDACGRTALHHAVICERWTVVKWLLKRPDAPLQLRATDYSDRAPAQYALEKMQRLALHHPCRRPGACVSLMTALMRDCCPWYRRLWRNVDRMLTRMNTLNIPARPYHHEHSTAIEELDFQCRGDLWDACRVGDVKRLEFLVSKYYDGVATARDLEAAVVLSELNWSLLHESCSRSHAVVVNFLLTHERLRCFRDSALLLLQDTSGCTALHYAARRQAIDVCELLVDECAVLSESDCDDLVSVGEALALTQDARGRTPLHWCLMAPANASVELCVTYESRAVVAKFLAQKCPASLHIRDHDGMTPLHLAMWRGDAELVQYFLDRGANADATTTLDGIERCSMKKALWAPCGLAFQQRGRSKLPTKPKTEEQEEVQLALCPDNPRSAQLLDEKYVGFKGGTRHLFECPGVSDQDEDASAAYYWIRRMTARRCASRTSVTSKTSQASAPCFISPTEQVICSVNANCEDNNYGDSLIGCQKYGGSCDRCRSIRQNGKSLGTMTGGPSADTDVPLPPLILALRVCSRSAGSRLSSRMKIVEMLLESGANPDGSSDVNGDRIELNSPYCALLEAVRTGHQSLIHLLLNNGAVRLQFESLERYLSTDWSVETLESVLSPLVLLPDTIKSTHFVMTLFTSKCFTVMLQLIDESVSIEPMRGCSVCRVFIDYFDTLSKRRQPRQRVDNDHLQFLCQVADKTRLGGVKPEPSDGVTIQEDIASNKQTDGFVDLMKSCLSYCLEVWSRPCNRSKSIKNLDENEAAVIRCIRHLQHEIGGDECAWFEQLISCGFFKAATMVLEGQLEFDIENISLDVIFNVFDRGTRCLVLTDATRSYHRAEDFLCVWLSKLLLPNCAPQSPLTWTITTRTLACACRHNLPLCLIDRCLELIAARFPCEDRNAVERLMEALQTTRVCRKRLEQWLVVHRRLDVIHSVFRVLCRTTDTAWEFWRELMAASAARLTTPSLAQYEEDAESEEKWIDELLVLPSIFEATSPSSEERKLEVLEWLVIHRIVPTDCDQMMRLLLPCIRKLEPQRMMTENANENAIEAMNTSLECNKVASVLRQWCTRTRLVYTCARWNATRVLNCTLEAIRSESPVDSVDVWLAGAAIWVDASEGYSPITIARLLGHCSMYQALANLSSANNSPRKPSEDAIGSVDASPADNGDNSEKDMFTLDLEGTFGFLRALLIAHDNNTPPSPSSLSSLTPIATPSYHYFTAPSVSEDLEIACRFNRVQHLTILMNLLPTSASATSLDGHLLGRLVLTAVANGSLGVLRWLLSTFSATNLTEVDKTACVRLAARRMAGGRGDVFVKILLLLLDHSFPAGRLTGDGGDVTILHFAACVGNSLLARCVIARLLAVEGCDINVLDPYGNTPVVCALASGCLKNACFFIQHANCRLEAEYEGQSCFYYALNLVPSLPARYIVKVLLMNKRSNAFLQCEADAGACSCKSFEVSEANECDENRTQCNFCGHEMALHRILPLPSWFRDQYDTYVDGRLSRRREGKRSGANDEDGYYHDDQYGEDDNFERDQEHRTQVNETETMSDHELENTHGRLNAAALERLALIRYNSIINEFGLQNELDDRSSLPMLPVDYNEFCLGETMGVEVSSVWPMFDACVLDASITELQADGCFAHNCHVEDGSDIFVQSFQSNGVHFADPSRSSQLSWFIQMDAAMVHPSTCVCQSMDFVTTPQMLLHVAISRWIQLTITKALGPDWKAIQAFNTWRYATVSPSSELTCHETSSLLNKSGTQSGHMNQSNNHTRRELMLKRAVITHWRLGRRVLSAFRTWKLRSLSFEQIHHALENSTLDISAAMRRKRLETLQRRLQQVEQAARTIVTNWRPNSTGLV